MSHHKENFHVDESRSRRRSHSNSGTHSFSSLKDLLQPALNKKKLWLSSLISFAVGFVWGIGDATIIPFLLNHGVSNSIASLVFLTNPIIGIFLHPMIGKASDSCTSSLGKRRPFIFLFAILLVSGCVLQIFADSLDGVAVIVLIFAGFFLVDSCADQFLGPGRSMMLDMVSDQHYDTANAIFAFSLSLGWVAAFVVGAFPIEDILPSNLFSDSTSPANRHIETLIGAEGVIVIICVAAACWRGTRSSAAPDSDAESSSSTSRPLIALCLLQFSGYCVSCAVNWYWTSFLHNTVTPTSKILLSFVGIGCQGIFSLLSLMVLPMLNATFGVARVYILLKFMLGACACAMLFTSDPIILTVLCIAIGMPLAAMDSNPYTMAEEIADDDSSRGYFIGVLDNMLTMGQVLVAAASGAIIQYMGQGQTGIARMFALFGAFAIVIDAVATVCSIKWQLFTPRPQSQPHVSLAEASPALGSGDSRYSAMKPSLSLPLLADHD